MTYSNNSAITKRLKIMRDCFVALRLKTGTASEDAQIIQGGQFVLLCMLLQSIQMNFKEHSSAL